MLPMGDPLGVDGHEQESVHPLEVVPLVLHDATGVLETGPTAQEVSVVGVQILAQVEELFEHEGDVERHYGQHEQVVIRLQQGGQRVAREQSEQGEDVYQAL